MPYALKEHGDRGEVCGHSEKTTVYWKNKDREKCLATQMLALDQSIFFLPRMRHTILDHKEIPEDINLIPNFSCSPPTHTFVIHIHITASQSLSWLGAAPSVARTIKILEFCIIYSNTEWAIKYTRKKY